jgi:hypothetical protein
VNGIVIGEGGRGRYDERRDKKCGYRRCNRLTEIGQAHGYCLPTLPRRL